MAKFSRLVFVAGFVTFCIVVIVASSLRILKNIAKPALTPPPTVLNTTPTPVPSLVVTPQVQYQNPFNDKTQYANPFATYENPFNALP